MINLFKKFNFILFISCILFIIIGCKKEEISYNDGDRVTIDGVVYEYDVPLKDEINTIEFRTIDLNYFAHERPYYDYKTADIYSNSKPIYHSGYPVDLIRPENMPITSDPFLGDYEKNLYIRSENYNQYPFIEDEIGNISTQKVVNTLPRGFEDPYSYNHFSSMLQYLFSVPTFWIVNYTGDDKEVFIPDNIDGIFVAGIGYGAFHDRNVKNKLKLKVEQVSSNMVNDVFEKTNESVELDEIMRFGYSDFPFFIMPFGLNYIDIDIAIDRTTYIYSRGLNNVNGKFSVNDCAILSDGCIYSDSYFNSQLDLNLKYIESPMSSVYTGVLKYLPIVNTKITNFSSLEGFMLNEQIYVNKHIVFPPFIIKGYTDTNKMQDKLPKTLILNKNIVSCLFIDNNEYKTYLTDSLLVNQLDTLIIVGDPYKNNELYIENDTLYFHFTILDTNKTIEVFKIPKNCKVKNIMYPL